MKIDLLLTEDIEFGDNFFISWRKSYLPAVSYNQGKLYMFKVDTRDANLKIHKTVEIYSKLMKKTASLFQKNRVEVRGSDIFILWNGVCCSHIKFERDNWFGREHPLMRGKSVEGAVPTKSREQANTRGGRRGRGGRRQEQNTKWVKKGEADEEEERGQRKPIRGRRGRGRKDRGRGRRDRDRDDGEYEYTRKRRDDDDDDAENDYEGEERAQENSAADDDVAQDAADDVQE